MYIYFYYFTKVLVELTRNRILVRWSLASFNSFYYKIIIKIAIIALRYTRKQ